MTSHPANAGGEGCALATSPVRSAPVRSPVVSFMAAGLVAGGVFACGFGGPLPATAWAAAFLFFVVESDLRELRIPNWLTLPALAAALLYQGLFGVGLLPALAGAGCVLAVLLPAWIGGFLGAGDVKAALPLGALWGVPTILALLIWSAFVGGLVGFAKLASAGALGELFGRWRNSLLASLVARRPIWFPPAPGSAAASVLPFGLILGIGAIATLRFGVLWA